jgi:hypothetical protein
MQLQYTMLSITSKILDKRVQLIMSGLVCHNLCSIYFFMQHWDVYCTRVSYRLVSFITFNIQSLLADGKNIINIYICTHPFNMYI